MIPSLLISLALVVFLALALLALVPTGTRGLAACPRPAADAAEALARLDQLRARDGPAINPLCRTAALLHPGRAERAAVLLHGYTNCPQQFVPLGRMLHARGYNVLIPRLPRQGYADRMTDDHGRLSAEEYLAAAGEAVDIARGLGARVTVAGISGGGTLAAWLAQARPDIDRALVLAPLLDVAAIPRPLRAPLAYLSLRIPNYFSWWDAAAKETLAAPPYGYPRYASRAYGQIMRLARSLRRAARRHAPAARAIVVVTCARDIAIDNRSVAALAALWRDSGHPAITTFEFGAELGLAHDFIDPHQPGQRIDLVYPRLIELME